MRLERIVSVQRRNHEARDLKIARQKKSRVVLGEFGKRVIEREFEDAERSEAAGFSHGDFGLVIQALDDTAGKQFLSAEVIQDQLPMDPQRPGDLLHWLDAGPHRLAASFVEELPGPRGRVVIPPLLKGFLEKVHTDGSQAVAEQIAESEALVVFEVVFASEQ